MPTPDDEPRTDERRPTTNVGGDLIGGNQINAQGSQGYIGQAQTVTQNFIRTDAPATPLVPACPQPNAARLFGRDAILTELVNRLIGGADAVAISAVRGLPGVGKTDLLRAVGNDARITAYFHGGVLYAELGPAPDPSQWLRRWITALGDEPPRSDDAETLAGALRAALAPRCALLILDDVWDAGLRAAKLLRDCGSPDCRALASSRSPRIAQEVAKGAPPLALDVLVAVPALALLRQSARDGDADVVARDEAGAAELVAALGGLPLALKLAGGWLRANYRQPRYRAKPCAGLLKVWRSHIGQLRGDEARPGLTDEKHSLDAIIGLSYAALPDDATRAAAAALAAFGATPLDWDWDAMAAVWATDEETTAAWEQALVASGLLDYDADSGRYSLHQTVEAFLALRAEPAAYERHAAYYVALTERCRKECKHESTIDTALATLDREIGQMGRGQQRAADAEPTPFWDARLIDYAFACWTYFNLRGRYDQMIAWSEAGRESARRRGQERDAATLLNNIALVYNITGHYDEAITAYEEAIAVHRSLNEEADLALDLGNLGVVYKDLGRYDEAIAHYQQSLEITRRIGAVATTANQLGNLGNVCAEQGRYDEAIAHYQQSLEIKRRIGDTAGTASTLGNLGNVYQAQRRYDEAIAHHQQSLDIAHHIGAAAPTARQCWNLGTLYEKQGDLTAALPLIEEAAQIAERIGMPSAEKYRAEAEDLRARIGGAG